MNTHINLANHDSFKDIKDYYYIDKDNNELYSLIKEEKRVKTIYKAGYVLMKKEGGSKFYSINNLIKLGLFSKEVNACNIINKEVKDNILKDLTNTYETDKYYISKVGELHSKYGWFEVAKKFYDRVSSPEYKVHIKKDWFERFSRVLGLREYNLLIKEIK